MFKILGTIGAIAAWEKLGSSFDLELGVLLPFNEYRLTAKSETDIKSALVSFYFQDKRLRVRLRDFLCMPEGYGTARYCYREDDKNSFGEGNTAILMLGYRNTSCLFFRRGTVSKDQSGTTDLGFYTLIDKLVDKVPHLRREDILKAIKIKFEESWSKTSSSKTYFAYSENWAEIDFATLVPSKKPEEVKRESANLKKIYDLCLAEYWCLLKNWLDEILPRTQEIDSFVFVGGSYDLLQSYLNDYAESLSASSDYTYAYNELKKYLLWRKASDKDRFMRENLAFRFADAWGFFVDFANYDLNKILDRHTGEVIEINGN